jgi:hypothetical protein
MNVSILCYSSHTDCCYFYYVSDDIINQRILGKHEAEVGYVVTGTMTRTPSSKREADNTDHSSSQEKVKANPEAKAQEEKKKE